MSAGRITEKTREHFRAFSKPRLQAQSRALGLELHPDAQEPKLPLSFGRSGYATANLDGVWLHSRHDPFREAQRQLDALKMENEDQLIFFFGAGLGYALELFLASHENPVVWIEPRQEILLPALGLAELSGAIAERRLVLLSKLPLRTPSESEQMQAHDLSAEKLEEVLEKIARGRSNSDIVFFGHPASYRTSRAYSLLQKQVEDFLNKKSVNLATLARFDRLWMHNLIRNFPALLRGRPVRALFASLPSVEAIVCGAGPSLSFASDMRRLRGLREGRLLIAVDTAYHVLLAHGVLPDIVVCVDPQAINQYYIETFANEATESLFVVDPTLAYLCLRHIPENRLFFFESPFPMFQLLGKRLHEGAGSVAYGGSVSTNAYDLALKLGCKSVLLFGQDLAFSKGHAHAAGATLEARLLQKENRFFRHEQHNYRQLSALPVHYLPGIRGKQVPANEKLRIFHRWFEGRFSKDRAEGVSIRDLKSDGARFSSLDYSFPKNLSIDMSGKKAPASDSPHEGDASGSCLHTAQENEAGRHRSLKNTSSLFDQLKTLGSPVSESQRLAFCQEMELLAEELRKLALLCKGAERLAQECLQAAEKKNYDKKYFNKINEMNELDQSIRDLKFSSEVAGSAMQRILFSLTENFESRLSAEEKRDPHRRSARESLLLYTGLREVALDMEAWIKKSLQRIRETS